MTVMKISIKKNNNEMNLADFSFKIIYLILIFISTIGNLITIFGYMHKGGYKKQTTFMGFIILSLIHLILLYMSCFDFIQIDYLSQVLTSSDIACLVYNILYRFFILLEPWTITGIHFEGFIVVFYPLKRRKICSHKMFLLYLLLTGIISFAINSQFFHLTKITNSICYSFHPKVNNLIVYISVLSIFNTLLPNVILIVLSVLIITKLNHIGNRVNRGGHKTSKVIFKKFLFSSLVFILIFVPLRLLNFYSVLNTNYEDFYLIRKILALLICSYYSLYFLIHIFIMTHLRSVFDNIRNKRVIIKNINQDNLLL
jgi:hypothetical protein